MYSSYYQLSHFRNQQNFFGIIYLWSMYRNNVQFWLYLQCRLQNKNMTAEDAYEYFVLKAQNIALTKNWSPVNWYNFYIHNIKTHLYP